jgi:hypothetical protein
MKHSSRISLIIVLVILALGLMACGDSGSLSAALSPAATTGSQAVATPTVTAAATTAVATTAAPASTAPATTTAATTAAAPTATTAAAPTTAVSTTAAATTRAASPTAAAPANTIRKTDWIKVLKNDPQLTQEPPFDPSIKVYISINGAEGIVGAPDLDNIVYVDMDKNGQEEAAIPLISGGTAGNIGFLLYRQAQPLPRLIGWQEGYKQGLKAVDGKLVASNAVYSGWEPNCCPSGYSTITYALSGDKLTVASSRTDGYAEAQPPTVDQFYALIGDNQLEEAYQFLSGNYQKANPYNKWAVGFATTRKVTVESSREPGVANTVRIKLSSTDATNGGGEVTRQFNGTWKLVWSADRKGWLLDEAKIQEANAASGSTGKVLPLFQPVLASVKQKTGLKIALPTVFDGVDASQLYAYVEKADKSGYFLEIGYTPDCNGATACRYGSLAGEPVTPGQKPLSGTKVTLANGLTGYFTDASCGASCGDSTLTWQQGNVRYTVGSKAGLQAALVKIANSAITNGPV